MQTGSGVCLVASHWTATLNIQNCLLFLQVEAFARHLHNKQVDPTRFQGTSQGLKIIQDPQYGRLTCTVDLQLAEDLLFHRE